MAKQKYSEEFKAGAVKMVIEQGLTSKAAAARLGVHYQTLLDWVQAAKSASPVSLVSKELPPDEQIRQLKAENALLRQEREILKKATAFFAKERP